MQSQFTDKAKTALLLAGRAAKSLHQNYVGTEHILLGLIKEGTGVASRVLTENGAKEEAIREMIQDLLAPETPNPVIERDGYSPRAEEVLEESHRQAEKAGSVLTGTEHILLALLGDGDNVAVRVLQTLSLPLQKIMRDTLLAAGLDPTAYREELGRRQKKSQTGTLELYSRDLTKLAAQGKLDPVVGRDQEIGRVIQILSRRTKNNPCLVGEPGVGKTAIVEGLALRITEGSVPDTVKDKRVLMLDLSGMIAGSKYRGEFEERIRKVIREVTDDGNILLFLDELHTLIGAGGAEGAIDASNILKPSLARGEIQLIGATTLEEYRKYIEKDAALERRFQPVTVEEPTEKEAIGILQGIVSRYEEHHKVKILPEALEAAVHLSNRYINDRKLPDKAIDVMDEAAAAVRLQRMQTTDEATDQVKEIKTLDEKLEQAIRDQDLEEASRLKQKLKEALARYEKHQKRQEKSRKRAAGGDSRGYRKGHFHLDKGSGEPPDRKRERTAVKAGIYSAQARDRTGRSRIERCAGDAPRQSRTAGSETTDRFVFVPRSHRCRKDGAFQGAGRSDVWFRKRADPRGHVGIYGRALCFENDRLASGLCRL